MLYLLWCAANDHTPEHDKLKEPEQDLLLKWCVEQKLTAYVNMAVCKADECVIDRETKNGFSNRALNAIRLNVMMNTEKNVVFDRLNEAGIWYMPLKGCVIKEYYPNPNLREMGDIDVLIAPENGEKVRGVMEALGYLCWEYNISYDDIYHKEPIYTFEMHRYLFLDKHAEWVQYYSDIDKRLLPSAVNAFEYSMSDEDFYIYFILHGLKHFRGSGIGMRFLLDIYLFHKTKTLNRSYVDRELKKLGADSDESIFVSLAEKVFGGETHCDPNNLPEDETNALLLMMYAGIYGNMNLRVASNMKSFADKDGKTTKLRYVTRRVFSITPEYQRRYPTLYRHRITRPLVFLIRVFTGMTKKRRRLKEEWDTLNNIK